MSQHKESQKKQHQDKQHQDRQHQDKEGMAQGADAADTSSLKKQIDFEGQTPNQQKKAS